MKKILIFICLAFTCQLALAQTPDEKKKKMAAMFGFSVGLNYANIVGEDADHDPLWGAQAGFYFAALQTKQYILMTYLLYTMMGAKPYSDQTLRLNYLAMPIVFSYLLVSNLYLGLGLQPGLLLSAKSKFNDQSTDVKDSYKSFDLGIPFQLSYFLGKNFSLGLRVVPGLTKINETGNNNLRNFASTLRATIYF